MNLFKDIKNGGKKGLVADLVAGLTVAVILVPQGLAYALLAGLPPVYGLYAALVPLLIYPFFASSKVLAIGPVALMAIIVLSGVSIFAEPGTQEYTDLVLMTALLSGVLQIAYALLGLGALSSFLSRPVMNGFISAAAVIIMVSQLKFLLTLDVPRSTSLLQMIRDDFQNIATTNIASFIMGVSAIVFMVVLKRIHRKIPVYLLAVAAGSLLIAFTNIGQQGIPIVADIPQGLPTFYAGFINLDNFIELFPAALIVSLICFIGSFSMAQLLAFETNNSTILAKKELFALGMAKVAGSFFLAFPSTGSFSRSAVNQESGAQSGLASIITGVFIGLTLLFLGTWFYYLPIPVLAAIVLTTVFPLIKFAEAKRLYISDRRDFWILVLTFVFTLSLGIVNGIIAGIVLSLGSVLVRYSKPHYAELGRLPGTETYRNINRFHEAIIDPNVIIVRYDQDLFFGNAEHFYQIVREKVARRKLAKKLVLHIGTIHHVDSSALQKVGAVIDFCEKEGIELYFTNISGPVRDIFHKAGIYKRIGADHFHLDVADAVLDGTSEKKSLSAQYSQQNNLDAI